MDGVLMSVALGGGSAARRVSGRNDETYAWNERDQNLSLHLNQNEELHNSGWVSRAKR